MNLGDKINKIDELPQLKEEIEKYFKYLEKRREKIRNKLLSIGSY